MKTIANLLLTGFIALICMANSCADDTEQTEGSTTEVIVDLDPLAFQQQMKTEPGKLIDVRTSEEFEEAHIPGAVNIDINGDDFKQAINALDMNEVYYVYCQAGSRSVTACGYMEEIGFSRLNNLEGGISAWMDMNLPVIRQSLPVNDLPQVKK